MAVIYVSMDLLGLQENTHARTHTFNIFNEEEPSTAYVLVCTYGTDQLKYTYVLEYVSRTS